MNLDALSERLAWPSRLSITAPTGAAPSVLRELAQRKIGDSLSRSANVPVTVGILVSDPSRNETEAPFAIVCEFSTIPSHELLRKAHALAWNFSRSPLLITVDPASVRAFSCCEIPQESSVELSHTISPEISDARMTWDDSASLRAARSLHWINLVTGAFFSKFSSRFPSAGRADQTLLLNLRAIRGMLASDGLRYPVIHDLLGRIIFVQFLFHRTDSSGNAALNVGVLQKLNQIGVLRRHHDSLSSILNTYDDAYRFFEYLDHKFNGDLFARKASLDFDNEPDWDREQSEVSPEHLKLLAEFVRGEVSFDSGQRSLFPLYSFDTIPLEFISSIYEEFVSPSEQLNGVHYTPSYIVDLVLDEVLPWSSPDWNVRVLDPACGSGIFLVKAYQRLIHRWKIANKGDEVPPLILRNLLQHNIYGTDIQPEAVRVASFSLYLAMCDEIDPRHYWTRVRFPQLRGRRLNAADFFADAPVETFDLVIGNAPWGRRTMTEAAREWGRATKWQTPYNSIGALFLPRALSLTNKSGTVAMLQPITSIISSVATGQAFRKRFFSDYQVLHVVNLSALRFGLFQNSVGPACLVVARPKPPTGEVITYTCPKPTRSSLDDYRLEVAPQDIATLSPTEAAEDPIVWTALMWGSRRDFRLIRRLATFPTLEKLEKDGHVISSEGIIWGNRKNKVSELLGKRILKEEPNQLGLYVDADALPVNHDPHVERGRKQTIDAFSVPQLIIRQTWKKEIGRFEAALVRGVDTGVLCSQSFLSVHAKPGYERSLQAALFSYNSLVAVYFLLLTSGRFGTYRPETTVTDMRRVPIPVKATNLKPVRSREEIDELAPSVFELKLSDWQLIADLVTYTLPDFKGDRFSPGRQPTVSGSNADHVVQYCEHFINIVASNTNGSSNASATVFRDSTGALPVRLAAIHLEGADSPGCVAREEIDTSELSVELTRLNKTFVAAHSGGSIFRTKAVRVYDIVRRNRRRVPTVYIIKPDEVRYWTGSIAMLDADAVLADIITAATYARPRIGRG